MDETYGTYVDDEYFDNHDYDDDTDDDNDHRNASYTWKNKTWPWPTLAGHELIMDFNYGHHINSKWSSQWDLQF